MRVLLLGLVLSMCACAPAPEIVYIDESQILIDSMAKPLIGSYWENTVLVFGPEYKQGYDTETNSYYVTHIKYKKDVIFTLDLTGHIVSYKTELIQNRFVW